jgi:drug/metabolite transporter (DMT)-like permease
MLGETRVSAGAASLIGNTQPAMTVLLAVVLLRERISVLAWIGIAISFAGAALIAIGASHGAAIRFQPAALFVVLASLCSAVYTIVLKLMLTRYTAAELTIYSIWFGTAFAIPWMGHLLAAVRTAEPASTLSAVYLGVVSIGFGYAAWSYALANMQLAKVASAYNLIAVFAIAISYVWLAEIPSPVSLLGGAISIAGVLLVTREQPAPA